MISLVNYLNPPHQCGHSETAEEKSARQTQRLVAGIFAATVVGSVVGLGGSILSPVMIPVGLAAAGVASYWAAKGVDRLHHRCPDSIDKHTVVREAVKTCLVAAGSAALGCVLAIPLMSLGVLIVLPFSTSQGFLAPLLTSGLIAWLANNAIIGAAATRV